MSAMCPRSRSHDGDGAGLSGSRPPALPTDGRAKTLHLTPMGEAKAEEINRVRTSLLKDIGPDDLAATFDVPQGIEQSADRTSEQHSVVEEPWACG
jgi:hypothetical protein